jgi:hypothetical protein
MPSGCNTMSGFLSYSPTGISPSRTICSFKARATTKFTVRNSAQRTRGKSHWSWDDLFLYDLTMRLFEINKYHSIPCRDPTDCEINRKPRLKANREANELRSAREVRVNLEQVLNRVHRLPMLLILLRINLYHHSLMLTYRPPYHQLLSR